MAHFYSKDQQSQLRTFNSSEMFTSSGKGCEVKDATYMNVLNMFRKVFKNIHINDLLS